MASLLQPTAMPYLLTRAAYTSTARSRFRGCPQRHAVVAAAAARLEEGSVGLGDVDTLIATSTKSLSYTYLGGNSWLLDLPLAGVRVLCDPWLIGALTFWDMPALYTGTKSAGGRGVLGPEALKMAELADVILLSQGWEDHAHRPTLRALSKDIPVVGSPAAAEVATSLGYTNVTSLQAGARTTVMPRRRQSNSSAAGTGATIWATAGASVGPPWAAREAGFIVAEQVVGLHSGGAGAAAAAAEGMRVYYEPHCSFDAASVAAAMRLVGGRVDVAITPVRSVDVVGIPLVNGGAAAVELLATLGGPAVVLPLRNGELAQEGGATVLMGSDGTTTEGFAAMVSARFPKTRVVLPEPGVAVEVTVELEA